MSLRAMPLLLLAVLLAAGALPAAGVPSPAGPAPDPGACAPRHVPGLGDACLLPSGLFALTLRDGTVLHTHGPDPTPAAGEVGFGPDAEQHPPTCADAPHMHVLYGHPRGREDRTADVLEDVRAAVRRMNAVLRADAMETGEVEATYRVACEASGEIAVATFQGPVTGGAYTSDYAAIVEAARAAGFSRAATNYLVFYDGASPGICGAGNIADDDRLAADNGNLKGPNYGVVFQPCWSGRTPMHENGHNMGAVQRLAPMSDLLWHCLEGYDVMCYTSEIVVLCRDRVHFDCRHDTYFHAKPPEGAWLATHWNIGSRLNGYLAFSDAPAPPPPGTDGRAPTEEPEDEPPPEQGNRTSRANATAPVEPAPQAPAEANDTLAPQAVVPDAQDSAPAPGEGPAEIPELPPAMALVALAAVAALRRRAS